MYSVYSGSFVFDVYKTWAEANADAKILGAKVRKVRFEVCWGGGDFRLGIYATRALAAVAILTAHVPMEGVTVTIRR